MSEQLLSRILVVLGTGLVACSSDEESSQKGATAGAAGSTAGSGGNAGASGDAGTGGNGESAGTGGSGGVTGGGFVDSSCTQTSAQCACSKGSYCTSCLTQNGAVACCSPCGSTPGRPLRIEGRPLVAALRPADAWL